MQYSTTMNSRLAVLVLDPDDGSRIPLLELLADAGFTPLPAATCRETRAVLASQPIALAILEHHVPGEDVLQLLREVFDKHRLPSIVVSAKSKPIHRILALELGADDFITRPCDAEEVLARVRAVLRRSNGRAVRTDAPREAGDTIFRFDGLTFDLGRRELRSANGHLIELTSTEIDLMGTFVKHPQVPLSRLAIIEQMGRQGDPNSVRTIDVLISKLRRKIEASAEQPELIKTVRGAGYVFTPKSAG